MSGQKCCLLVWCMAYRMLRLCGTVITGGPGCVGQCFQGVRVVLGNAYRVLGLCWAVLIGCSGCVG